MANFVVDAGAARAASTEYVNAKQQFDIAKSLLSSALTNLNWDDAAAAQWKEEAKKAIEELDKMSEKLSNNSNLLNKMAQAAEESQQEVTTGIGTIY